MSRCYSQQVVYRSAAVLFEHGCTNPGRQVPPLLLNCVRWHLIFVGPQYGILFTSSFWRLEMHPCVRDLRVGDHLFFPAILDLVMAILSRFARTP